MYWEKSCCVRNGGGGGNGYLAVALAASLALVSSPSSVARIPHQLPSPFYPPNPVTSSETHSYTMLMLSELNFMHRVSHTIKSK
jgi:hypothetical protein